ncbi:MAG: hypothetical protein OXC69_05585, partial [Candidatus Tectomicrobia bacterium]|nr:hypothetical protein [Candidatus Tectomicrobia bacterium]
CRLPTADCRLPTADCRLPTADCRLPTADCRPAHMTIAIFGSDWNFPAIDGIRGSELLKENAENENYNRREVRLRLPEVRRPALLRP